MLRILAVAGLMISLVGGVLPVRAGEVLDDILNYPVVDQRCPADAGRIEGMGLISQQKAEFITLSKEQPIGQTFTLGPNADRLWRVCAGICHWPSDWQQGEEITFTLYDSPAKAKTLYTRTLDFDHKWFKWDVCFDINIATKPNTSYYFELTHNGAGDNSVRIAYIARDDYKAGQPYVAGESKNDFDLYFVVITKPKNDRIANLQRLLSHYDMNNPALADAKTDCAKGDYDGACSIILRRFEDELRKANWIWRPDPKAAIDTTRVDRLIAEGRYYSDDKDKPNVFVPLDEHVTWREVNPGSSSYVRMNDVFAELGHAYAVTKNEKYAARMNELMADFIQDDASPFEGGMRGGRWVAMHQAWRLGDAWEGLTNALDSKSLTDDVRLAWIDYWYRMADFATKEHSGGNQANATAEALMQFADHFPLYEGSKERFAASFDKLVTNSLDLFRDDGACREPAMNYHGFSLGNLRAGLEAGAKFGFKPPEALVKKMEKAYAYTAYMLKPDGQTPSYGDTNCEEFRPNYWKWSGWRNGEALRGARMFGRYDLLYIATTGHKGARPPSNSYSFPFIGHYVLRSDWGGENGKDFDQARWLFLRGGERGSHGHDDLNMVTLYAYGRPLLIDPGRTNYGTPLMFELEKNRSHSVLLVDDLMMNHPRPKLAAWHTSDVMDFVDNGYDGLYPGVNHRRAIVFVRPNYYVMFDTATSKDPHRIGINFWLTPPDLAIDRTALSVRTNEPNGSNLLLKAIGDGIEITDRRGTLDLGGVRNDIPVVTFWRNGTANAEFATLMYPFPTGAKCEGVNAERLPASSGQMCSVKTASGEDIVLYTIDGKECATQNGRAACAGRAGLIRLDATGKVTSFALAEGSSLTLDGLPLARGAKPVAELSVEYAPDTVKVACHAGGSVEIASLGRKNAVVNGRTISVTGESFKTE